METMTPKEIRSKLQEAERNLTDAQRRYSRRPSTEARHELRQAADSLRWWAIQWSATWSTAPTGERAA